VAGEIVNRVANSQLKTIDLEAYYPSEKRVVLDIKQWLFHELILKEKEFRQFLKEHNWSQYNNCYIALTCSSEAIIPTWAYMLISTYLTGAKKIVVGSLPDLEQAIFYDVIQRFEISEYKDKPVIIKGCSNKPIPETAYIELIKKLQPVVKSIMFGEPCSTVPLLKKK
jgi:hypothetical protein